MENVTTGGSTKTTKFEIKNESKTQRIPRKKKKEINKINKSISNSGAQTCNITTGGDTRTIKTNVI